MLRCSRRITKITAGMTVDDFLGDPDSIDATRWNFAIIGEAMNKLRKLDESMAARFSEFDRIIGFRNQLVHGYRDIKDGTTWSIIANKLPILIAELERAISDDADSTS